GRPPPERRRGPGWDLATGRAVPARVAWRTWCAVPLLRAWLSSRWLDSTCPPGRVKYTRGDRVHPLTRRHLVEPPRPQKKMPRTCPLFAPSSDSLGVSGSDRTRTIRARERHAGRVSL